MAMAIEYQRGMSTGHSLVASSVSFDEATFRQSPVYARNATIPLLQADLAQLRNLDLISQKQSSKYGMLGAVAAISCVLCIVGIVVSVINSFIPGIVLAIGVM